MLISCVEGCCGLALVGPVGEKKRVYICELGRGLLRSLDGLGSLSSNPVVRD